MKTKKIVANRFRITKTGVVLRRKQNARHLRGRKSKSQLRRFKRGGQVSGTMKQVIRTFMPYA